MMTLILKLKLEFIFIVLYFTLKIKKIMNRNLTILLKKS